MKHLKGIRHAHACLHTLTHTQMHACVHIYCACIPVRYETAKVDNGVVLSRPVIRLHGVVLTRIDPAQRDTSMIMRIRPGWDALRAFLAPDSTRKSVLPPIPPPILMLHLSICCMRCLSTCLYICLSVCQFIGLFVCCLLSCLPAFLLSDCLTLWCLDYSMDCRAC